ncbi:MAG: nitroreductase family protein [Chloroflexi bacterium]|nr:nitroreductase family protein [Chloroflexota bacterium]
MASYGQLMDTIRNRRNVRRIKPDPVGDDLLEKLVDAARWAPSGNNSQPWEFVVIKDPGVIEQVGQVYVEQALQRKKDNMPFHNLKRDWMKAVPAMIVIVMDPRWMRAYPHLEEGHPRAALLQENAQRILLMGVGAAIENMHLAAETLGLAMAWMTGCGEADDMAKLKAILGIPDPLETVMIAPIGYPYRWPNARSRREPSQITHWNHYDMSRFLTSDELSSQIKKREPAPEDLKEDQQLQE